MKKLLSILLIVGFLASGVVLGYATQPAQYKINLGDARWHTKLNAGLDALWGNVTDFATLINNWAIEDQIVTMIPVTCTYSDADTFTMPGDYTSRFAVGKVVQVQVAAGMVFSTVASSSYAAPTTTVNLNDAVLTDPITRVYVVATRDGLWPNGPGYVVAADYGTDRAALATADGVAAAAGKTLMIGRTYAIDDDLTLSANLEFQSGAILTVSDTKLLTINGSVTTGLYEIFIDGNATYDGIVLGDKVAKTFPEWWGAVGDGVTDDGAAINAAAECARLSTCKRISFPSNSTYASTTQLDLQELSIETGKVISTYAGPAVLIGDGRDLNVNLIVDRPVTDWTATHDGIHILGENNQTIGCYFDLGVSHSAIGIKFQAPVAEISICYNTVHLRNLLWNDIDIYVHHPVGTLGVCNETLVLGGNFGNSTAGKDCCIKMLSETTDFIDSWTFIKPSFEDVAGTGYAGMFKNTRYVNIDNARFGPGSTSKAAYFDTDCVDIIMTLAYGSGITRYDCAEGEWMINVDVRKAVDNVLHRLNDVGNFQSAYHDGTYWHVPGFAIINFDTGAVVRKSNSTNYSFMDGNGGPALYGESGYESVGMRVNFYGNMAIDYTYGKKLYIKYRMLNNTYGGGLRIKCYDSSGNCLSGNTPAYVQGPNWESSGTYYSIVGSHGLCALVFHTDVAYAYIGAYKKSNAFTGFEIYSPYQTDCYAPYDGPKELPGHLLAANAPTKWHFQVGDTVLDDSPTSGQQQGWVCVKRVDMTLTDGEPITETSMVVDDSTGVVAGDIVGVQLDTGAYHFTTAAAVPDGTHVTLTAGLPSAAAATNKVVANLWNALPNLP